MNSLQIFNNSIFGSVRATAINGEPWFVGKDIAEALGYSNPRDAMSKHVDEEDKNTVAFRDGTSGNPSMTVINESGLYSLVLGSKLPTAKQFKRWVTSEVLPAIRKHGAYATPATIENIISDPDFGIKLLQELKTERDKNSLLQVENSQLTVDKQIMQPKADYFDQLVNRNLLTNFTEAAKQLGVKRKDLIAFGMERGYLYRDKKGNLLPRANRKADGLFEVKQCSNDKTGWAGCQTLMTPKGVETFRLLMEGA